MAQAVGLGIDVGGTNSDAVLIDLAARLILGSAKVSTMRIGQPL